MSNRPFTPNTAKGISKNMRAKSNPAIRTASVAHQGTQSGIGKGNIMRFF